MPAIRTVVILATSILAAGCVTINTGSNQPLGSPTPAARPTRPSTPASVNGKTISIEMSDEEIFAAFGLKPSTDDIRISRGPDGYSASYQKNEQMVSIARSLVTGTVVYSSGPIAGEWRLGGGLD